MFKCVRFIDAIISMIRLSLLFLMLSVSCLGQTRTYSVKKQQKDFEILKESLLHVTGQPYLYTDSATFVHLFDSISSYIDEPRTAVELFRAFSFLTASIQCGHTNLSPNTRLLRDYLFFSETFPFSIMVFDGKLYAADRYGKDPRVEYGNEIIEINGHSSSQVLHDMHAHVSSDAKNVTLKNRYLRYNFNLYYYITFGSTDSFKIKFTNSELDTLVLGARAELEDFKSFRLRYRSDPFAQYGKKKNEFGRLKSNKDLGYSLLELPSFQKAQGKSYQSFIDAKMRSINKKSYEYLVIDLRGNLGGKPQTYLMGYFTNSTEHIIEFRLRTGDKPTYQRYLKKWNKFYFLYLLTRWRHNQLAKSGHHHIQKGGIVVQPESEHCDKQLIVLIDGLTFSAGSNLAANLKDKANAIVIGEESGGSYKQGNTGQLRMKLPKTKFGLSLNPIYFNNNVKLNQGDAGLIPDIMVLSDFSSKKKDDPFIKAVEDYILTKQITPLK